MGQLKLSVKVEGPDVDDVREWRKGPEDCLRSTNQQSRYPLPSQASSGSSQELHARCLLHDDHFRTFRTAVDTALLAIGDSMVSLAIVSCKKRHERVRLTCVHNQYDFRRSIDPDRQVSATHLQRYNSHCLTVTNEVSANRQPSDSFGHRTAQQRGHIPRCNSRSTLDSRPPAR